MDSQKRRSTGEKNKDFPKKNKVCLLTLVEQNNIEELADVIKNRRAEVSSTCDFSFNDFQFVKIPPLFAAALLDNKEAIQCLANSKPQFKTQNKQGAFVIPTPWKLNEHRQLVESLELIGSILVIEDFGPDGLNCWEEALRLRKDPRCSFDPKETKHSDLHVLAFRGLKEFLTSERLSALSRLGDSTLKKQAFIVGQRILSKYGCFPNLYFTDMYFKQYLQNWEQRNLSPESVFAVILHLIELFQAEIFQTNIEKNPAGTFQLIKNTLDETKKLLNYEEWISKINVILNFDLLMIILHFCYKCQIKVNEFLQEDEVTRTQISTITTQIIICLLKTMIIVSSKNVKREEIRRFLTFDLYPFKKSSTNRTLQSCLNNRLLPKLKQSIMVSMPVEPKFLLEDMSLEIRNFNRVLANLMLQDEINQSSLTGLQFDNLVLLRKYIMHQAVHLSQEYLMNLLEFCCRHQIQVHQTWQDDERTKENRVKIITLTIKEVLKRFVPPNPTQVTKCLAIYVSRFGKLASCGKFHDHLVNQSRKTALELFEELESLYPNPEFIEILHPLLESVKPAVTIRPLTCLAADFVKRHRLPYEDLPLVLQNLVLEH